MKLAAQAEANKSDLLNESCVKSQTSMDSIKLKDVKSDLWLDFVINQNADGHVPSTKADEEDRGCNEDDIDSVDIYSNSSPFSSFFQLPQSNTTKKSKKGRNSAASSTVSLRSKSSLKISDGSRGRQSFGGLMCVIPKLGSLNQAIRRRVTSGFRDVR